MAPQVSNDLSSPVSLLWAHQLRREHAAIVTQLEELKELHPSASEVKKLVTRTEKAEAATNKIRKELTELKTAHQKTVKVVENIQKALQKTNEAHTADVSLREKSEENFRAELKALNDLVTRQGDELASTADELRGVHLQAEEENSAIRQKLQQKEDDLTELRSLIHALDQKVDDAVTVIKDSIECPGPKGWLSVSQGANLVIVADGLQRHRQLLKTRTQRPTPSTWMPICTPSQRVLLGQFSDLLLL
jgi:uncharacterized phage infection (PIP) family protein YhgE